MNVVVFIESSRQQCDSQQRHKEIDRMEFSVNMFFKKCPKLILVFTFWK